MIPKAIAIGCDHAGYNLKEMLKKYMQNELKLSVVDKGCFSESSVDYPDYAAKVAAEVANDQDHLTFGVVVCGSGIGISMVCNKVNNIIFSIYI